VRNAFADELTKVAAENNKVILLSADIGNKLFDKLKTTAPDRVINTGVAEANTIGVASGLAMCGMRPIAYTITPFITTRCLEQIRIDLAYHNQPVLVVGVGAGLGYAELGPTHHSCEDVAFLRSIPNMTVLCPADPQEVRALLREALHQKGPVYMRIGKKGEQVMHANVPDLKIGKAFTFYQSPGIKDGKKDVCIINTSTTLPLCMESAHELEKHGLNVEVVNMHTVKPLDTNLLKDAFTQYKTVVTVEEHGLIGGLGAAVAEWLVDSEDEKIRHGARLIRFGTKDEFMHHIGEREYALEFYGITKHEIVKKVTEHLHQKK
jgi:transketolase